MSQPTRQTTTGRVYLDLRARARREGGPTDELLVLYILERFLCRLSVSSHRSRFVLKGGVPLAAFDERRPNGDVDLLAANISNDAETTSRFIREVLAINLDDGVVFEPDGLRAAVIRDTDPYTGVRITVPASLARARHPLRIDVNIGDPVTPAPVEIAYPTLLGEPFEILGYPIETVLAEKIVTMVDRGDATTRERDFADVLILTVRHALKGHCDQGTGIDDQRAIRDESRPTVLPAGVLRVGDPTGDEADRRWLPYCCTSMTGLPSGSLIVARAGWPGISKGSARTVPPRSIALRSDARRSRTWTWRVTPLRSLRRMCPAGRAQVRRCRPGSS